MHLLRRGRVEMLSLDRVLAGARGAAITFDDGFKDCMEYAVPLLRALRFPAAFFVVAGCVGGTNAWMRGTGAPEEPLMGWDDLRRLVDEGFAIGSHSLTHGTLTREEVVESRLLLEERLGIKVRHFAYPRGEVTAEWAAWVREAGYSAGWATRSGNDEPYTRRRLPVSGSAGLAAFAGRILKARLGYYGS